MELCRWSFLLALSTAFTRSHGQDFLSDDLSTAAPFTDQAPCSSLRPGDVDFQTVDLIAVYKLDRSTTPGVTVVSGSQDLQRAYRIGNGANLSLPVTQVFPHGLPPYFTVVGTFNAHGHRKPWSLVQAKSKQKELALTLLPHNKKLMVVVQDTKTFFKCPQLFTAGWHKVHVAVTNKTVHVAVDCKELSPQSITEHDLINATTVTIVTNEDKTPAPIDLQWLSISCNRYNITEESCEEIVNMGSAEQLIATEESLLFAVESSSTASITGEYPCNVTCPQGPPGTPGDAGLRGERGLPGRRGVEGPPGPVGPGGPPGERGPKGEPGGYVNATGPGYTGPPGPPGKRGEKGDKGDVGEKGEPGLVGLAGIPGADGKNGQPGEPGPIGPPGERGPVGPPGTAANINASIIHGAKGEMGSPGKPGRDGERGLPGPPGLAGERGPPGQDGYPGLPGQRGEPGRLGSTGERGPEGPQGPEGQRGLPGPPGPPGSESGSQNVPVPGPPGPPGERGTKGDAGAAGSPGPPGKDGTDGAPGAPGQRGPPGLPAPPTLNTAQSPSLTEGEIRSICEDLIRARLQELTAGMVTAAPRLHQKRGAPGRPGPAGSPGIPGEPGSPGPRGYPGETGEPGAPGKPGRDGAKGEKGDRGPEGVGRPGEEGPRGPPGHTGAPGPGGRPGERGDPGKEGAIGPRGVQGPRGTCDCVASAAYYAYAPTGNTKGP